MQILKCNSDNVKELAVMNKQLIDAEKSNNTMSVKELENRMTDFLADEYDAYFFVDENTIIGYALINRSARPLYLRQFFIKEEYRRKHYGTDAFHQLLKHLAVDSIDIEVLPWNEQGVQFWSGIGFKEISRCMRYER